MKKITAVFISLIIFLSAAAGVMAESKGAVFSIDIDDEQWTVVLYSVNESEYAEQLGTTPDALHAFLKSSHTYVDAISLTDKNRELTVRKLPAGEDSPSSLLGLDKIEQEELAVKSEETFELYQCECEFVEIYEHAQTDFLVYDMKYTPEGKAEYYGQRYFTVINGSNLYIDMFNYSEPLSVAEKDELRTIVDTVRFDGLKLRSAMPTALRWIRNGLLILIGAILLSAGGFALVRAGKNKKLEKLTGRKKN